MHDENLVDEVGEHGVVLADGRELSYGELGRLLQELSTPSLLMDAGLVKRRNSAAAGRLAEAFQEASSAFATIDRTTTCALCG